MVSKSLVARGIGALGLVACGSLPAVAPGKRCPENVPAGQVCLEEGWVCTFHRAPGETQATPGSYWWDSAEAFSPVPPACMLNMERAAHISPVFVRRIRMDIHEFTNGDLVDLFAALPPAVAAQLPVPPERTGERPLGGVDVPDEPNPPAEPYTGWFGRTSRPRAGHPLDLLRIRGGGAHAVRGDRHLQGARRAPPSHRRLSTRLPRFGADGARLPLGGRDPDELVPDRLPGLEPRYCPRSWLPGRRSPTTRSTAPPAAFGS